MLNQRRPRGTTWLTGQFLQGEKQLAGLPDKNIDTRVSLNERRRPTVIVNLRKDRGKRPTFVAVANV